MKLDWVKAITSLIFAVSLLLIGGVSLHLFGVPIAYPLVFAIGVLIGDKTAFLHRFTQLLMASAKTSDQKEVEDSQSSSPFRVILFRLERYPAFPDVESCCYVVYRNVGKIEYLQAFSLEGKTAEFTEDEELALKFPRFESAQKFSDWAWFMNGCSYEFFVEMWILENDQIYLGTF